MGWVRLGLLAVRTAQGSAPYDGGSGQGGVRPLVGHSSLGCRAGTFAVVVGVCKGGRRWLAACATCGSAVVSGYGGSRCPLGQNQWQGTPQLSRANSHDHVRFACYFTSRLRQVDFFSKVTGLGSPHIACDPHGIFANNSP